MRRSMNLAKTYSLGILLMLLTTCAQAGNLGADISKPKDARTRVEEYRQVIREMFMDGSLLSDSDRFSGEEMFKKNVYLKPCSDGIGGLSQSLTAWDFSELHTKKIMHYDADKQRYTLTTTDESIVAKVKAYFEQDLAYVSELARAELLKAGYPLSVFDGALNKMISDALSSDSYPADPGQAISYDYLLSKVQQYHDRHNDLPEPRRGNGCGDGGIKAIIKPDPNAARVWLISEFDYKLCKMRGFDPDNRNLCGWREVTGASFSILGGIYRIYAKWDDGRTSFSRRNIAHSARSGPSFEDDHGFQTYTILVRP